MYNEMRLIKNRETVITKRMTWLRNCAAEENQRKSFEAEIKENLRKMVYKIHQIIIVFIFRRN